jgi:H+-transporting ATPase
MHFELEPLQTAMFMQLVVAGHLLLFSTRAGRFFFEPPFPERKLFWAIMGTQLVAALMAANGWLLTPISWSLIGFIWIYNLVWLVVIDAIKVAIYHHYDARELGPSVLATPLDPFSGRLGKLGKVG